MPGERRLSFGSVAELYDRARPSYPDALVDDVLEFAAAGEGDLALEVGAGTGKATALFARRGLRIHALEPSAEMARVARAKLSGSPNVTIEEVEFERWEPERRSKLLFSAQAWHWVDSEVGYARAREALEPGGVLAAFWNWPLWEDCPLRAELDQAYRRVAPELEGTLGWGPMHPQAQEREWWRNSVFGLRSATGFEPSEPRLYRWSQDYSTEEYLTLLQTHSDHITLPHAERKALLEAVGEVVDRSGGKLTLGHVTILWLARASASSG